MRAKLKNNQYVLDEIEEKDLFGERVSKYKILIYNTPEEGVVSCSFFTEKDELFVIISDKFDESGTVSKNGITIQKFLDIAFGEGPSERTWARVTKEMLYQFDKRDILLIKAADYLDALLN